MKHAVALVLINVLIAVTFTAAHAQSPLATAVPPVTEHAFVIHNFKTESGATLPEAKIVYGTYGHLNAAGDNAILLPSHYMANLHGYEWLIGQGKALDPDKQFLITSELFGNGRSSSPSNTPEPFHGPRFPVTTIRDNVEAVHQLLTQELHVRHLQAVIGFSMGAQQAFQWAVSYPDYMSHIVATSGTAKTYGHGIVRNESEITAIATDAAFENGDYKTEPAKGIEAFSIVWTAWLYSQEWWRKELWREEDPKPPRSSRSSASIAPTSSKGPTPTTSSCNSAPGRSTTLARRPASTVICRRLSARSERPSSTCPPPPTSISPWLMRSTSRSTSPTAPCSPSRRSGATPPVPAQAPPTKPSSTSNRRVLEGINPSRPEAGRTPLPFPPSREQGNIEQKLWW